MTTLNRFRIVKLPLELQTKFNLPELICADAQGLPFPVGQTFYWWLVDDNACGPSTARNYLNLILPFLTYLHGNDPPFLYTASAQQIREQVRVYLKEKLGCVVRPHRGGNYTIPAAKTVTLSTVRLFLTALNRFYTCAILKGWYTDANPLVWTARIVPECEFQPHMPPESGLTLPDNHRGRMPDTYFCVIAGHWRPQIIDDPNLPKQLLAGFACRRDQLIGRILFESGARIGEVLGLTAGDWRRREQGERALAPNKGSHGVRVKEIWWSSATAQSLRHYLNTDRRDYDPLGRGWKDLPDDAQLFINDEGKPYTYAAFYANWRHACRSVGLKVTPHQARHWFVTMALHKFASLDSEPRQVARQSLVAYMGWRNPETIQAYDHHIRRQDFATTHAALVRLVESGPIDTAPVSPANAPASEDVTAIPAEMWERLGGWLDAAKEPV
jgi:hypothetical protein